MIINIINEGVNMNIKRMISISLSLMMTVSISAHASVLGSETIKHARLDIGTGAVLETNVFYSDQAGVGLQTENFVEYTPNDTLVPVLINDEHIYGRVTASSLAGSLMSGGTYPTMLMNSDFFALQTGIPMSHQVIDGVLTVKDTSEMDAIGINEDGSAFISWLKLNTEITVNENTVPIEVVNKLRQPYAIYMLDDKFADTTKASDPGLNVIIGSLSGDMTIGEEITGVVEQVLESEGEIEIPDGKIVLTADNRVTDNIMEQLKLFNVGDKVTIKTTAEGDARWNDAKHILGAWGGRIITNGSITETDEAAAPRTAFGVKEDGTLVFYTLDGRTSGHSYGARLKTLAKRMLELGCTDTINLDGGGSTTLGAIYPGSDNFSIINTPSDGSERKVATFFGLINTAERTDKTDKLFIYPYMGNYLSGATAEFSVYGTDANYYKSPVPEGVVYTAPNGSTSTDGKLTITGDGKVTVKAEAGGIETSVTLDCYETPTWISLRNADNNKKVDLLEIYCGESINLTAKASVGNKNLIADDSCFIWDCTEGIGTIDSNGYFTAADANASGEITVTAGDYKKKIPVTVSKKTSYPTIEFEETGSGQVRVSFYPGAGYEINEDDIVIKTDGNTVETKLTSSSMNLVFADGKTHRINITAMNSGGFKTVASYTLEGEQYENIFHDVADNYWARKYITYMNNFKVVNGTPVGDKTMFYPASEITRGEFAVMVANMLKIDTTKFESESLGTADEAEIAPWCINHIKALSELGIMNGRQNGDKLVFDAKASLTRAEAATVISRLLPDNLQLTDTSFTDSADIPSWSKDAFTKLTSLKIMNGYEDGSICPLNRITRAEAIKMLYEIY